MYEYTLTYGDAIRCSVTALLGKLYHLHLYLQTYEGPKCAYDFRTLNIVYFIVNHD